MQWPNYPCKNDWWGQPILLEILDQSDPIGVKSRIFYLFARSDSAVTPSKKVHLTLIGSPLRPFNEPKMNIVRCS